MESIKMAIVENLDRIGSKVATENVPRGEQGSKGSITKREDDGDSAGSLGVSSLTFLTS